MSEATDNTATEHAETEHAEPDRPNNSLIFVIVIATLASLVVTVLFVNEVFKSTMEREISSKVLEPPSSALRGLRAMEQERLSRYQWANEKDGVVRIPIDQAVALTLKDYQEKRVGSAAVPAATTPEQAAQPEESNTKPSEASPPGAEGGQPPKDAAKPGDKDAAKPAEAAKPSEAAKPAEAVKPAEAAKPADAAKPAQPGGAAPKPAQPAQPGGAAPKPASPAPSAPVQ